MSKETSFKKEFTLGDRIVRRMGYGAMRITGKGIWGPPKDRDEAIRVLKRAVELGVNFIDTADSYGPHISEELIAEALYPYPPDLMIATKGGLLRTGPDQWPVDASPAHLKEALEGSLARLKLDQIALYQLHRIDPKVPAEKTFEFLQGVQEEGLVKHIGLSEVGVEDIKKAEEYFDVVSVQNMYSADNRKWESVLKYCEETGKAFIPWYPLNAGNVDSVKKIEAVAKEVDATPHQVALAWLIAQPGITAPIASATSLEQLKELIQATELKLDSAAIDKLNRASEPSEGEL